MRWFISLIILTGVAFAHDPTGHNAYSEWYTSQMQEEKPVPCCGDIDDRGGDAHFVDVETRGGKYFVKIDNRWIEYPLPVNPWHYNPTGHNLAWFHMVDGGVVFYCLRLAGGT